MILFKEDWDKYPYAVIDWDTPNRSFVDMVAIYEKIGVENRYFMLSLLDPSLKGIDPFDPELDPETMVKIAIEAKENPWYFFREILRFRNAGSLDAIMFKAHRGNIAMVWCYLNHITSYSLWPRQRGKSATAEALDVYVGNIAGQSTTMHIYCKDDQLRRNIIAREKAIMDELPPYLKIRTNKDANNTEVITWNALNNILYTSVAQSSIKAALNIGRGLPIAHERLEELAFCDNNEYTVAALLAAGSAARKFAREQGSHYGTIITTTAGFLNEKRGMYARKIYNECLPWTDLLYDCKNEEDLRETIRKNNTSRLEDLSNPNGKVRSKVQVLLEFNHRQLGVSDEEFKQNIEDSMAEGDNLLADFFNIWGHGNSESPISKEDLKRIYSSKMDVMNETISKNKYITRFYLSKQATEYVLNNEYIIMGIDTSDAIGTDDISICFRLIRTGEVIGAGNYNETNTITLAADIAAILIRYKKITMIIERKSSAIAMLDRIYEIFFKAGIDPLTRIFNWIVDEEDTVPYNKTILDTPVRKRDPDEFNKIRKKVGFATAGSGKQSRDRLYGDIFNQAIRNTGHLVRDYVCISQLTMLIRKNGRIDHPPGEHDDMVIAWLLTYWFLVNARNKIRYGIPNGLPLSDLRLDTPKKDLTEEEKKKIRREAEIRVELEFLKNKIATIKDPNLKEVYTKRYNLQASKIGESELEVLNIDDIDKTKVINVSSDTMARNAESYSKTVSYIRDRLLIR